jgi:hypothetical protein
VSEAVARADVERFLEAAPVPLGIPAEEVERRLGKADKVLEKDGRPIGFQYPARGVWLACEEDVVSAISFLTGSGDGGGAAFPGPLPGGLVVGDPPERVAALYGEPDRLQEIPLPRPPHAKLHLAFYDLTAPATVTFAWRTLAPDRIEKIVLARRVR